MGGREHAAIAGGDAGPAAPADVQAACRRGIFALPTFAPGVGPFGGGRGRLEGPAAALRPAERSALADLYVALVARAAWRLPAPARGIVVEGPLARNAVVCGLLAALAGQPVHASPDATGTAVGAALLLDAPGAPSGALPGDATAPLAVAGLDAYARRWRERAGS